MGVLITAVPLVNVPRGYTPGSNVHRKFKFRHWLIWLVVLAAFFLLILSIHVISQAHGAAPPPMP
jgi:hypothetical protein